MSDANDRERLFREREELVTNDAVAGETVEPGAGEGNNGSTGGSPREGEPILREHDPQHSNREDEDDLGVPDEPDLSASKDSGMGAGEEY